MFVVMPHIPSPTSLTHFGRSSSEEKLLSPQKVFDYWVQTPAWPNKPNNDRLCVCFFFFCHLHPQVSEVSGPDLKPHSASVRNSLRIFKTTSRRFDLHWADPRCGGRKH